MAKTRKKKVSELTDEDIKEALKRCPLPTFAYNLNTVYAVKLQHALNIPARYGCWRDQLHGRYELVKKIVEFSDIDYKLYLISHMLITSRVNKKDKRYKDMHNWAKQFIVNKMSLINVIYAYKCNLITSDQLNDLLDAAKINSRDLHEIETLFLYGTDIKELKSLIRVVILNVKNYYDSRDADVIARIMVEGIKNRIVTLRECLNNILSITYDDPAAILFHIVHEKYCEKPRIYQKDRIVKAIKSIKIGKPEQWLVRLYIDVDKDYIDINELKKHIESRKTYYSMRAACLLSDNCVEADEEWCKSVFDSIVKAGPYEEPPTRKLKRRQRSIYGMVM